MARIGVSDYSFRHEIGAGRMSYTGDFPAAVARAGIQGIECMDSSLERHLPDIERADIKKFQSAIKQQHGLDILAITGFNTGVSWGYGHVWEPFSLDSVRQYIDLASGMLSEWVETCAALGIPNIRFDAGGFQASHKVPITRAIDLNIEIYKRILAPACQQASECGVKIGVENHGYFTADITVLTKMLAAIPHLHVTCDLGNWPFESRLDDIKAIAGRVNFIHAKTHVFSDDGEEKNIDYGAIADIMRDAGFEGWWSIEWEGPALGDAEGVGKSVALIKKHVR